MLNTSTIRGTFKQIPYWKLRGRFHSCGYRDQEVAEHSGIGRYTMSARMNGTSRGQVKRSQQFVNCWTSGQDEIGELFFPEVGKEDETA